MDAVDKIYGDVSIPHLADGINGSCSLALKTLIDHGILDETNYNAVKTTFADNGLEFHELEPYAAMSLQFLVFTCETIKRLPKGFWGEVKTLDAKTFALFKACLDVLYAGSQLLGEFDNAIIENKINVPKIANYSAIFGSAAASLNLLTGKDYLGGDYEALRAAISDDAIKGFQVSGGKAVGALKAAEADKWRGPCLDFCKSYRAKHPNHGNTTLAKKFIEWHEKSGSRIALPDRDRIEITISQWVKIGLLPAYERKRAV